MGEGFPALFLLLLLLLCIFFYFFFFFFFFAFGCLLLLKKDFEGLTNVFPFIGGSGGPPPENFGKSRMQEKPSTTLFRLILYIFIFR